MINLKIWKKKINIILTSKYFFMFIVSIFLSYFVHLSYSLIQQKQNSVAFPILFDLLDRYRGSLTSTSIIPLEELYNDIIESKKKLGFLCNLHEQFILLEAIVLVHLNKIDDAMIIFNSYIPHKDTHNEIYFLYKLLRAIIFSISSDNNKKQEGLLLLEEYSKNSKYSDIVIFYHGNLLRKTSCLKQADLVWAPLKFDPVFNSSPYKSLIEKVRNCDY